MQISQILGQLQIFALCGIAALAALDLGVINVAVEYCAMKGIRTATTLSCHDRADFDVKLYKSFSEKRITYNSMRMDDINESSLVHLLDSTFFRLGVIIDLSCAQSMRVLDMASRGNYFIFEKSPTFWLLMLHRHIPVDVLQRSVDDYEPKPCDFMEFLMEPYKDKTNETLFFNINKRLNENVLKSLSINGSKKEEKIVKNDTEPIVDDLLRLKILLDNEITLAIRSPPQAKPHYQLYRLYKVSEDSKARLFNVGTAELTLDLSVVLTMRPEIGARDFGGTVLRAGSMIFQPEQFTTLEDLSKKEFDIWQKVSIEHIKLLSEELNFRFITRFFNDYGWEVNGTYTHLLGSFKEKKSILSATAALMRAERLNVIDYTVCPFRFQAGILFKEPSLPSVNNIFILPFSKGIWMSIGSLIVVMLLTIHCRWWLFKLFAVKEEEDSLDFAEVVIHILGAICQQGFSLGSKALSERMIILFLLLTSLILFSSYSACIVALLQSFSSAISSIGDITRSNFEVGVQAHFPFFTVLMKEANHPVIKEYYQKKISGKRGQLYFEQRDGIERMRNGMFAFEVDLSGGYNIIKQTFEEREKCGIKVLDLAPRPYVCIPVAKNSSYKRLFSERLIWQEETGMFDRSWKRWMNLKPKCEVNRIGFISVGLTEFCPVLWIFTCGLLSSCLVFFMELALKSRKHQRRGFSFSPSAAPFEGSRTRH